MTKTILFTSVAAVSLMVASTTNATMLDYTAHNNVIYQSSNTLSDDIDALENNQAQLAANIGVNTSTQAKAKTNVNAEADTDDELTQAEKAKMKAEQQMEEHAHDIHSTVRDAPKNFGADASAGIRANKDLDANIQ